MAGTLPPQAGFLDPAERGGGVGDDPLVDAHHAVFQPLGHPPDAPHVAGVEVGGQAGAGVVGQGDALGLGVEGDERRHRPEDLVGRYGHGVRHVFQDGRLVEQAAERMRPAAHDQFGAGGKGVLHE